MLNHKYRYDHNHKMLKLWTHHFGQLNPLRRIAILFSKMTNLYHLKPLFINKFRFEPCIYLTASNVIWFSLKYIVQYYNFNKIEVKL